MVLLGTRGPQLFPVLQGGLGSPERLSARSTQRLTNQLRIAFKPEYLKNPANHRWNALQGWNGFRSRLQGDQLRDGAARFSDHLRARASKVSDRTPTGSKCGSLRSAAGNPMSIQLQVAMTTAELKALGDRCRVGFTIR